MSASARAKTRWLWGALIVVLVAIAAASVQQAGSRRGPQPALPPIMGAVPSFTLIDQHGRPVTREALRGAPWIADFIFTRCGGQCPMMTARMRTLQQRLPADARVRLVSFSVDPSYDTPPVLAAYAARAGAGERWFFLTGDQATILRLSRDGFKLAAEPEGGPAEEPVIHSVRLVLVDGQERIRGYYDGSEPASVEQLLRDLAALR